MLAQAFAKASAKRELTIWPENWPTWRLFASVSSQWRHAGLGGERTGLCYEAVYPLIDRMNLNPSEWDQVFEDIQAMESAAMASMRHE